MEEEDTSEGSIELVVAYHLSVCQAQRNINLQGFQVKELSTIVSFV